MHDKSELEILLLEYIESPDSPDVNHEIALEYEKLGQTASAISFYLRAAEFGYESAPAITYVSTLKVGSLFESFGKRGWSACNSYLLALSYQPSRPEAYFYLARYYERQKNWSESYAFALAGQIHTIYRAEPTASSTEYLGDYCLIFQQAVAAWWLGRKDESFTIFHKLIDKYEMTPQYVQACKNNLNLWKS
jgi:hypothetical protein